MCFEHQFQGKRRGR